MATKQPSIYFTELALQNLRCFGERQVLRLHDEQGQPCQWTLILGNNGAGKTTLLKCLAWMRPTLDHDEGGTAPRAKPGLDAEDDAVLEGLLRQNAKAATSVSAQLAYGGSLVNGGQRPSAILQRYEVALEGSKGKLSAFNPSSYEVEEFHDMRLFCYGAGRHMEKDNLDRGELGDPVQNLFSMGSPLYDAEELLLQLDYQARGDGGGARQSLEATKRLLADLLPEVESGESVLVYSPKPLKSPPEPGRVMFKVPSGEVPLGALSLGYQTMIAWATDLAFKLFQDNKGSASSLKAPAVVLVDEIDLHLHPSWQRKLKGYLTKHFPNVQFICTAHSPLMAQEFEDENLVVVKMVDGEAHIENGPESIKGWRVDQILLSELYGLEETRSLEVEAWFKERDQLLAKPSMTAKDKSRLKALDQRIEQLPVWESESSRTAFKVIEQYADKLRDAGEAE